LPKARGKRLEAQSIQAAADDHVAVVEHGGLARRDRGERLVGLEFGTVIGKRADAPAPGRWR
jgi:hypothetical protein